jgi:hypothetical protein
VNKGLYVGDFFGAWCVLIMRRKRAGGKRSERDKEVGVRRKGREREEQKKSEAM